MLIATLILIIWGIYALVTHTFLFPWWYILIIYPAEIFGWFIGFILFAKIVEWLL